MTSKEKMLCLIRAKACKRCGGDLSLECDVYGVFIQCIQCGATFNKDEIAVYSSKDIDNALKAVRARQTTTTGR